MEKTDSVVVEVEGILLEILNSQIQELISRDLTPVALESIKDRVFIKPNELIKFVVSDKQIVAITNNEFQTEVVFDLSTGTAKEGSIMGFLYSQLNPKANFIDIRNKAREFIKLGRSRSFVQGFHATASINATKYYFDMPQKQNTRFADELSAFGSAITYLQNFVTSYYYSNNVRRLVQRIHYTANTSTVISDFNKAKPILVDVAPSGMEMIKKIASEKIKEIIGLSSRINHLYRSLIPLLAFDAGISEKIAKEKYSDLSSVLEALKDENFGNKLKDLLGSRAMEQIKEQVSYSLSEIGGIGPLAR